MQFDTSRAFPYPVLRPGVDDYVDGDIQVTVDFSPSQDGSGLSASVAVYISVPDIVSEVKAGRAKYVVVFACRDTYYRYVHYSDQEESQISFPLGSLRGEVQVFPYVVATTRITDYCCDWINPEFGGGPFRFGQGEVLAMDQPQVVYIDRDVFKPLSSIFVLVKDDSIRGHEWHIRPTDDKVQIAVSAEAKERIDLARNNKGHRAVLMNSIYFAAVMQCVSLIKQGEDDASTTKWGSVMLQKCHNEGINLHDSDEYLVAEKLMKCPFRLIEAYVFKGSDQ